MGLRWANAEVEASTENQKAQIKGLSNSNMCTGPTVHVRP